MVPLPARRVLLPALGFLGLLALSLWTIDRAEARPERVVYGTARTYLDALGAGELETALTYLEGLSSQEQARYAAERQGWLGHVTSLEIAPDGRTAEVFVAWSHPQRGAGRSERLLWALAADGRWHVRRSDLVPTGGTRRS